MMTTVENQPPQSKDALLRSYGLALLFLGMAVAAIGRALHASDTVKIAMTIVSVVFSLSAIALFVKVSKRRAATLVAIFAAVLSAAAAVALITLVH